MKTILLVIGLISSLICSVSEGKTLDIAQTVLIIDSIILLVMWIIWIIKN